ncbi:ferritin-like domain-containing protein [uncultured Sphingomonas sp.]|uniref:ferritin-like domain-containing protein n=1 Tax=uncultured Sphingomonas sp. TaxID=158754 RepID=UPI0025D8122C|nr:ferritin-like domain-containing protein [uncultured Sphingomonas sp.]
MNHDIVLQVLDACDARRAERRAFMKNAGFAVAGATMLAACSSNDDGPGSMITPTPTPIPTPSPSGALSDQDVLNFALNLEYLEAQFYSFAANGVSLPASLLSGTGQAGAPNGARQVTFKDDAVARYAREIAGDEQAHVAFLRSALGSVAVAQPNLDLSADVNGAFSTAARAAGLVGANQAFDPYASDENFLLAAFIFEDVGVSAYKGASPLITNKTYLEAAAGILAAEAYHAGLIRTTLYRKGLTTPSLIDATEAISNARDSLDGSSDLDQGIRPIGTATNIVPTDSNGVAFSRSAGQVLNIAYLNKASVDRGGFFPTGVNGTIKLSAAS